MIKRVTVVNHLGESLKLDLTSPEKSGFIVKSIEGLGPVKATVNTTKMSTTDGALYFDERVQKFLKKFSGNIYYWNKWYKQNGDGKKFKMYLPKQDALQIISEDDYNMLLDLSNN